jgi:parallel beta-helix repeat protein
MHTLYLTGLSRPATRRCLLLLLLLGPLTTAFGQTTYYVSNAGNDAHSGRSADAPFQSIAKVNALSLKPGDQVLFRRGDTFRGTVQIRQSGTAGSPIVVDAYGSGAKPVLAGSVPVTGWTSVGPNTWQATCPECGSQVTGLFRDGTPLPLGRYPNADAPNRGYLTVQSHAGKNQLTSQQTLTTTWTGGEVVVRPNQWIMDRAPITQQSGNTLTLNNSSRYDLADGWGYFIQSHPATLDQAGEWYYNPANRTIRLYEPGNPNGQPLTATAYAECLNLTNVSYVSVRNLHLTQARSTNLIVNSGTNLTFSGNDITDAGEDGLLVTGFGSDVLAENNRIEDANNNGCVIQPYQNVTFRGNTIRRAGIWPGRGRSGDGTYVGLNSLARQAVIENNVLDQVGYNGVSYTTQTTLRRNVISNFCLVKSDGSGLYIWNSARQVMNDIRIESNLIFNGIGAPEGTPGGAYSGANGIFFDECVTNATATDNTVFNCHGLGFFLHASSAITLTGNTAYNNGEGQLALTHNHGLCPPRENTIRSNVFVSRLASQFNVKYESNANDLGSFGTFDQNVYARPFEDLFKVRAVYHNGSGIVGADLSLTQWQNQFGKDLNSKNSPLTFKPFKLTPVGTPKLDLNFSSNAAGWDTWGPQGNGRAEWDNANRLDGGSLRIAFPSASNQKNSYVIASTGIGSVTAGKTYRVTFDAVATSATKRVEVFLRQKTGSYRDLDARAVIEVGTARQSYELGFTANVNEGSAIVVFQVSEDGQTVWLDNLRVQEATRAAVNPDDVIRFVYNPTGQPTTVPLDGRYRDARGGGQSGQVTLAPFSSLVLLRDETGTTPPPPPTVALREPENPASAVAGLDYAYFEGGWSNLPDFDLLTPRKTGTVGTPDLSVRARNDQFGVRYRGYVDVPLDGTYTFYTTSDDGSKLFIGTTEVVSNDGLHGAQERSGTLGLKAGRHAITVTFFENGGGETLTVSYAGPNLAKQSIPASALYRVGTQVIPPGTGTGLRAEYFNNRTLTASAVLSRTDATVNFDWGTGALAPGVNADNASVRWTGQVEAPVTGSYTFSTSSDDGVRLWVNGQPLINNWTDHATTADNGPLITLDAGQKYDIRMEYFENGGGAVARLLWSYPGQVQQIIPQGRLHPASAPAISAPSNPVGSGPVTYLSDLTWTSATNGYGPVEKDRSNGETGGTDGRTIILNGVTYAKGLGVHASSEITYHLGGQYATFLTDVGLDDEISGTCGSVGFEVYLDGALAYTSGTMRAQTATKSINVSVLGKQTLRLVVTTGGDDASCDHGDWAGARLIGTGSARLAAPEADELTAAARVYPVPAHEEVWVRYFAEAAGEATVRLLSTTGQPVREQTNAVGAGLNEIRVPVGTLRRGAYVLVLSQGIHRLTRKVLLTE